MSQHPVGVYGCGALHLVNDAYLRPLLFEAPALILAVRCLVFQQGDDHNALCLEDDSDILWYTTIVQGTIVTISFFYFSGRWAHINSSTNAQACICLITEH